MSDIQCGVGRKRESGRREGIKKRIAYGGEGHMGRNQKRSCRKIRRSRRDQKGSVSVKNAEPRSLERTKQWCLE